MTFLPVLERELRVAARKRSTFWFRVVAAIVAVIIGGIVVLSYSITGTGMFNLGGVLFSTLTWFAMAAALFSGLFFTADCLSEEKREGTIGFLFLTDLRGHDVVGGKLLTQSLRAFYGLLAVFPVLAMIMLMGGVTGAQFWKTNLALVNALICSLMTGVFVSARSTNAQKALAGTFCVLLLFVAVGPIIDAALGLYDPYATVTSPIYVLRATYSHGTRFWAGLALCQLIAWGMFAWTCVTFPRRWQESERITDTKRGWAQFWKYGTARERARRRRFLDSNPILWLTSRERWQSRWLWIGVLLGVAIEVVMYLGADNQNSARVVLTISWGYLQGLIAFFIYIVTASQATRFFADARRSGFLELLLATPLSVREIVSGNWRAFLRLFGWPIALMVAVQLCLAPTVHWNNYRKTSKRIATTRAAAAKATSTQTNSAGSVVAPTNKASKTRSATNGATTITMTPTGFTMPDIPFWVMLGTTVAGVIAYLFNLAAIYWFGAWMGLTSKNGNSAILKTFVFVMVIPWFVISFIGGIISIWTLVPMITGSGSGSMMWFPFVSAAFTAVIRVIADLVFITTARTKLNGQFRAQAVASTVPMTIVPPVIIRPATI